MAEENGDDSFQSILNDASKKKAKDELNELNDEDRKLAVQTLRQWVLQQDWLKSPTDFRFLLRFLRVRKFSQLAARETLENYWTIKTKRPDWHKDLDPCDPDMQAIFRARIYYSPLKYDKDGCRWLFSPFGHLTQEFVEKYGVVKIYRAMILFIEWICVDENVQVNGLRWFIDYTDLTLGIFMKFSKPEDQKNLNQYLQKCSPARMKAFYLFNEPTFFDVMYSLFSMFSRKKILDRVNCLQLIIRAIILSTDKIQMVGKNMAKVYEVGEKSMLPDEYLPDDHSGASAGPESQIIEEMLADMMSPKFRDYIREITSSEYGVDLNKRSKSDQEPVASFRKLNVD